MVQTVSHIADECAVSKLHDGGLQRLHSADNVAVNWLERTVTKRKVKVAHTRLPSIGFRS